MLHPLLEPLDASKRDEYAEELDFLLSQLDLMTGEPKKPYKETPLGRGDTRWLGAGRQRRLVLALLALLEGCQETGTEPVVNALLEILTALLRRSIPFTEQDID